MTLEIERYYPTSFLLGLTGVNTDPYFGLNNSPIYTKAFIQLHKQNLITPNLMEEVIKFTEPSQGLAALFNQTNISDYLDSVSKADPLKLSVKDMDTKFLKYDKTQGLADRVMEFRLWDKLSDLTALRFLLNSDEILEHYKSEPRLFYYLASETDVDLENISELIWEVFSAGYYTNYVFYFTEIDRGNISRLAEYLNPNWETIKIELDKATRMFTQEQFSILARTVLPIQLWSDYAEVPIEWLTAFTAQYSKGEVNNA